MAVPARRRTRCLAVALAVLAGTGTGIAAPAHAAPSSSATASAADAQAQVVSENWLDARTVDLQVASPALHTTAPVRVILPTNWAQQPTRTWPVLYLLQGAHDDYTSWTRETDVEAFTAGKDVITVMPSTGSTGIPSKWWNFGLPGAPDYETFVLDEVMQILRTGYRASTVRAVAGVSTGGYGAMALAARHPGAFRAAASYSGILDTTLLGVPSLIFAIVSRELQVPFMLWGDPVLMRANWNANNPKEQADRLRGTALYVSSGSGVVGGGPGDLFPAALESTVWPSAHSFTDRLNALNVPVTTHYYAGGAHSWDYWRTEFHSSWPMLAQAMGVQ